MTIDTNNTQYNNISQKNDSNNKVNEVNYDNKIQDVSQINKSNEISQVEVSKSENSKNLEDKVQISAEAEKSLGNQNLSKTTTFESMQKDMGSLSSDNKLLKQIQEDVKLLNSNNGSIDSKAINERIAGNIKNLENISKEDKENLLKGENLDKAINNNIQDFKNLANNMIDFLNNKSNKSSVSVANDSYKNVDFAKESMFFNKNNVLNIQGSFASVQANVTQSFVSNLLK